MHPFTVLSDPVRRRVVEDLATGPRTAGELTEHVRAEFAVSQPAVSNHLRVLRDAGFVRVTPQGSRRIYELDRAPLDEIERWMARHRRFWNDQLDALDDSLDAHV
ncbi:DNA-binding transcriptional ArsR family regulator [Microbacterium sp. AK009]|uniref:ArsR/SmtB family transcription factor n=1 Tax=Microbacterium sp. AK009 TaxID=2723068 RepID=UPI0015C77857|nr:metalloregulator ArsR/SmtB family transcription factor [Microbacterium sp. AK009]NYF15645.1 DNA-binding transcriptional ArsR family regulator [Microbacterium sp. AK009]